LSDQYKDKILKSVIEKCEKILAEKQAMEASRKENMDKKRRFEDDKRRDRVMDAPTTLVQRGQDYQKKDDTQLQRGGGRTFGSDKPAPTGLASRGEGLAQRGTGLQRGDGFSKPQGDGFSKPQGDGLAQRGTGLARGDGFKKDDSNTGGQLSRGGGLGDKGGLSRGDGFKKDDKKDGPGPQVARRQLPVGDKKPENKPGLLQRGAGFKK